MRSAYVGTDVRAAAWPRLEPEVGMEPQTVDYLVIGAGPAGLGYFLDRGGRDYGTAAGHP
jgi:hypothetical protein